MVHIDDMSTDSIRSYLERREREEQEPEWEYLALDVIEEEWCKSETVTMPVGEAYSWRQFGYEYVITDLGRFVWRRRLEEFR